MKIFLTIFFGFAIYAGLAEAKPAISLCVGDWEGYASPDLKSGAYIDLMNEVFGDGYELKWSRYSFPRCQSDFKEGKFDVLVGENKSDNGLKGTAQFDAAFLLAVYSGAKFPKWDESKILNSAKLAWPRNYGFEKIIPGKTSFTETNNPTQGLRQLIAGRFDVFLDDDIDALTRLLENPEFKDKGLKLSETKVKEAMVLIFKDSPEAKNLVKHTDDKINAMRKSGRIKALFDKYKLTYVE